MGLTCLVHECTPRATCLFLPTTRTRARTCATGGSGPTAMARTRPSRGPTRRTGRRVKKHGVNTTGMDEAKLKAEALKVGKHVEHEVVNRGRAARAAHARRPVCQGGAAPPLCRAQAR